MEPIEIKAEAADSVKLCQFDLSPLHIDEPKIVIAEFTRQAWLVMSGELRCRSRHVCPFGEVFAPKFIVLGNWMELWKVKGDESRWRDDLQGHIVYR